VCFVYGFGSRNARLLDDESARLLDVITYKDRANSIVLLTLGKKREIHTMKFTTAPLNP
jgi:hypothetical protein